VFKGTRKRGFLGAYINWVSQKQKGIEEGKRFVKGGQTSGKVPYAYVPSSRDPNLEPSVLLREKWEGSGSACGSGSGSGITHPGLGSPSFPVVSLTLINMTK
jgi:hypothetical protein